MQRLEEILTKQGWQQVSGGYWANLDSDDGKERSTLEEAMAREHARLVGYNHELQSMLDTIKTRLGLLCEYHQMADAIQHMVEEREVERRPGDKVHVQETKHFDGCACLTCDPEAKRVPRPFCPDCKVPMSNTSDALGGNPRLMCERCGRTTTLENVTLGFGLPDGRRLELKTAVEKGPADEVRELKSSSEARERLVPRREKPRGHSVSEDERKSDDELVTVAAKRLEAIDGDIEGIRSCIETVAVGFLGRILKLEEWIKAEQDADEEADKAMNASYQRLTTSGDGPCEMPPPATVKQLWRQILSNRCWILDLQRKGIRVTGGAC